MAASPGCTTCWSLCRLCIYLHEIIAGTAQDDAFQWCPAPEAAFHMCFCIWSRMQSPSEIVLHSCSYTLNKTSHSFLSSIYIQFFSAAVQVSLMILFTNGNVAPIAGANLSCFPSWILISRSEKNGQCCDFLFQEFQICFCEIWYKKSTQNHIAVRFAISDGLEKCHKRVSLNQFTDLTFTVKLSSPIE